MVLFNLPLGKKKVLEEEQVFVEKMIKQVKKKMYFEKEDIAM